MFGLWNWWQLFPRMSKADSIFWYISCSFEKKSRKPEKFWFTRWNAFSVNFCTCLYVEMIPALLSIKLFVFLFWISVLYLFLLWNFVWFILRLWILCCLCLYSEILCNVYLCVIFEWVNQRNISLLDTPSCLWFNLDLHLTCKFNIWFEHKFIWVGKYIEYQY